MKRIAIIAAIMAGTLGSWNLHADEAVAYTVVEGDDIHTIAGQYEVTEEDILITNGLESDEIEIGTVIYIPPQHAKGYFNPDDETYTVANGDDLYAIAERFGTTVDAISGLNNLSSNEIETGSTLRIPN